MSLRRLGEELYRPAKQILSGGDNGPQDGVRHRDLTYIQSSDLPVRFVSALIILKTDTQGEIGLTLCFLMVHICQRNLNYFSGRLELFLPDKVGEFLCFVKCEVHFYGYRYLMEMIFLPKLPRFCSCF